ncbi:urease accessory UreF family protein [Arcobacteraceae bacterium]|nr:urease accessory UreF family protein [Arcobacteraceae bacterium]
MQIFDGSFPSGAFVHSFGLEPHIVLEKVTNILELKKFLHNLIVYQYQGFDFVLVKKVYKYFEQNKLSLVIKEDEKFSCMTSFEYTKSSQDLGENYLRQINNNIEKEIVQEYFEKVKSKLSNGNELIVLTAYAYELDMDIELFLLLWCKKNILNIAMTSLKISRIKPSQIQQMLFEFDDELEELIENTQLNINNFNPIFEEIIYQHKNLEPKMFVT